MNTEQYRLIFKNQPISVPERWFLDKSVFKNKKANHIKFYSIFMATPAKRINK